MKNTNPRFSLAIYTTSFILVFLYLQLLYHSLDLTPLEEPVSYCKLKESSPSCKNDIPMFVSQLTSEGSLLPYQYHDFDFCMADESLSPIENIGQAVFGDRIRSSPYKLSFLEERSCNTLCHKTYEFGDDSKADAKLNQLKKGIILNYQHHWIVDNIPVTWCYELEDGREYCTTGFPMGCYMGNNSNTDNACIVSDMYNKPDTYYIFNHVDLVITYHSGEKEEWGSSFGTNGGRIFSVKVRPRSIKHSTFNFNDCNINDNLPLMAIPNRNLAHGETITILYTFSVKFEVNNTIKWSARWDNLLNQPKTNIQWYSILASLMVILSLTMIILYMLRRDNIHYNKIDSQEKYEWKFRPPGNGMLLSVFLGSGVQVFLTTLITLVFGCLGFLAPSNRGALTTCAIVLYICLGIVAGYVSARMYKSFGGENWVSNAIFTSTFAPGIMFVLFLAMNMLMHMMGSSATIQFSGLLSLLSIWLFGSLPFTCLGSFLGFGRKATEYPVRTNQIPRQIPDQSVYTRPIPGIIMGGVLTFECIFIQLFFILNSLWFGQMYNMYGFLFLSFVIFVIACAETTILHCYFHLHTEDYHWPSFLTSGFSAVYLFLYCVHYFVTKLNIEDTVSIFLYFGYTSIMVFLFFLLAGTIGFFACFWFIHRYVDRKYGEDEKVVKVYTVS